MDWYVKMLKEKYADFNGRERRKEFWMFYLVNFVIIVLLISIEQLFHRDGFAAGIFAVGIAVPFYAALVRRLHDTDRSGWWFFLGAIPIIGIFLIVILASDGTPGQNQYGPDPKNREALHPSEV